MVLSVPLASDGRMIVCVPRSKRWSCQKGGRAASWTALGPSHSRWKISGWIKHDAPHAPRGSPAPGGLVSAPARLRAPRRARRRRHRAARIPAGSPSACSLPHIGRAAPRDLSDVPACRRRACMVARCHRRTMRASSAAPPRRRVYWSSCCAARRLMVGARRVRWGALPAPPAASAARPAAAGAWKAHTTPCRRTGAVAAATGAPRRRRRVALHWWTLVPAARRWRPRHGAAAPSCTANRRTASTSRRATCSRCDPARGPAGERLSHARAPPRCAFAFSALPPYLLT